MSTDGESELAKRLKADSDYFDQLVELVPPKIYFGLQHQPAAWKYLHSSTAKAAARQEAKDNHKKAKRLKLDPATAKTTLDIQREQLEQEKEKAKAKTEEATEAGERNGGKVGNEGADGRLAGFAQPGLHSADRAATYGELRQRLEQRLAALRHKRHADDAAAKAKKARDWQKQKRGKGTAVSAKKAKGSEPSGAASGKLPSPKGDKENGTSKPGDAAGVSQQQPDSEPELRLQYGRIKTDHGGAQHKKPKRKQKTEQILAKAAALREQLAAANKSEEAKQQVAKHVWSAAADRAAGQKVLDDPKLLKRSLQKQKKLRQKSAEQWESRKGHQKASMAARQLKRKDHLQQRIDTKKKNKIAKREKKLLRPGFEGRVGTVINQAAAGQE